MTTFEYEPHSTRGFLAARALRRRSVLPHGLFGAGRRGREFRLRFQQHGDIPCRPSGWDRPRLPPDLPAATEIRQGHPRPAPRQVASVGDEKLVPSAASNPGGTAAIVTEQAASPLPLSQVSPVLLPRRARSAAPWASPAYATEDTPPALLRPTPESPHPAPGHGASAPAPAAPICRGAIADRVVGICWPVATTSNES